MEQKADEWASDGVPFLLGEEKNSLEPPSRPNRRERWANILPYSVALNVVLLVLALLGLWNMQRHDASKHYIPNEIYTPAQSAVEYQNILFTGGLKGDGSKYLGSTPEVDEAWDDLYNKTLISQILPDAAAQLPNATTRFSNDTDYHIVELDVFHQLHCLNMLRKLVYPDAYPTDLLSGSEEAEGNVFHLEHCYEQLRQSLQCASDLATITWQWSRKRKGFVGNVHTMHTCRNFDKIHEWSVKNVAAQELNFFEYVEGAPIFENE
ncbi:Cyclochlorotine biosynthesis protein O [Beauveria bassiana]|nr:Cyclochlorotine biosynthesis protein O [Beauveria bassiana]